jgi:hypothetical protein
MESKIHASGVVRQHKKGNNALKNELTALISADLEDPIAQPHQKHHPK